MHGLGLHKPGIAVGVTSDAYGLLPRADHFVGRMLDGVVAVAGDAAGESHRRERVLVGAGLEQLRLEDVAIRADVGYVGDPGRGCPVIAMARSTGRRTQ